MPSSRYSRDANDQYDNARPERRQNDRRGDGRVQDVSYSEIQRLRRGERASMDQPLRSQDIDVIGRRRTQEESDADSRTSRRTSRRDRYAERNDYDRDDREYDYRRSRRRKSAPGYDYGGGERPGRRSGRNDRDRDRGSRDDNQQVTQYQQRGQQQQQQSQQRGENESQENDQEPEKGFFGRHFDRGSDGVITAAAGAALGAITARHFSGPKEFSKEESTQRGKNSKHWKMVGGAVLGAAAFNAGENWFQNYFEEQQERNEDAEMGLETAGELIGAMGPDVL